jgi:hypothetical protein
LGVLVSAFNANSQAKVTPTVLMQAEDGLMHDLCTDRGAYHSMDVPPLDKLK